MTQFESSLVPVKPAWKTTWMVAGGIAGALLGVMAVYLYVRSIEAEYGPTPEPRPVKPGAALQVALSILAMLRQIASLGLD